MTLKMVMIGLLKAKVPGFKQQTLCSGQPKFQRILLGTVAALWWGNLHYSLHPNFRPFNTTSTWTKNVPKIVTWSTHPPVLCNKATETSELTSLLFSLFEQGLKRVPFPG